MVFYDSYITSFCSCCYCYYVTLRYDTQTKFLSFALGGPEAWKGKSMKEAHAGMKITEEHFGAIAGHLVATLEQLEVPKELIDEVIATVATTHDDIVHPQG